jgi:uncharacterized membrane protein YheB (UPF0754 family)
MSETIEETATQKIVRAELERRRDTSFTQSFDAHMNRHIAAIESNFDALTREIAESVKAHNRLVKDLEEADQKSATAHNQLVADVKRVRDTLHEEQRRDLDSWVKRMDRNFNLEVVALQEKTIRQLNTDLEVMRRDMTTAMMNTIREELATETVKMFVEAREEIRRELRAEMAAKIKLLRSTFVKRNRK